MISFSSAIISVITAAVGIYGARIAYKKWKEEKDKEEKERKKEKEQAAKKRELNIQERARRENNRRNIDEPLVSYIIQQEAYRKMYMSHDDRCSKDNLPIITYLDEFTGNHPKVKESLSKAKFSELLEKADKSCVSFELLQLINLYLFLDKLEHDIRQEIINCYTKSILNIQKKDLVRQLWDVYLNPDTLKLNSILIIPEGFKYVAIIKQQKNIENQLVNAIIDEYINDLKMLNLSTPTLTWDNILDGTCIDKIPTDKEASELVYDYTDKASGYSVLQGKVYLPTT
ncbi:hypothetical protein SAMN04487861_11146 [Selenomonas ruminantium]|uniref:Uncharacterized protein n=1 Tax=Selenomonas ruminantium TaxID=971 RepID=A0A1I3EQX2_SELRU|nr:hypothetical protein [Selenomonas ruminantium]SFI01338.1 hypothetical protein SAMN04487861_11146 [Selenomonas ruminantium]